MGDQADRADRPGGKMTLRLTAVETGLGMDRLGDRPLDRRPAIWLHLGRYYTPLRWADTVSEIVELIQSCCPELELWVLYGRHWGCCSEELERKIFRTRLRSMEKSLSSSEVYFDDGARFRYGLAMLKIVFPLSINQNPVLGERPLELISQYPLALVPQGSSGVLASWLAGDRRPATLFEAGAILLDDTNDRDLLVAELSAGSAARLADIAALFEPFVDPAGLIAPQVESPD